MLLRKGVLGVLFLFFQNELLFLEYLLVFYVFLLIIRMIHEIRLRNILLFLLFLRLYLIFLRRGVWCVRL